MLWRYEQLVPQRCCRHFDVLAFLRTFLRAITVIAAAITAAGGTRRCAHGARRNHAGQGKCQLPRKHLVFKAAKPAKLFKKRGQWQERYPEQPMVRQPGKTWCAQLGVFHLAGPWKSTRSVR